MDDITEQITPFFNEDMKTQVGLYAAESVAWLKMVYAMGAFLFLVFILAEASIISTKIYSDTMEDKEKYKILAHLGASQRELRRAISKEVALFYILPLMTGLIDSFFAIEVLGDFLTEDLLGTFIVSAIVCVGIFIVSYIISIENFKKVVKVVDRV